MILFIKHIDVEGPGTIETYFDRNGYQSKTVDLSRGDKLPDDLSAIEAVVGLGGPMNVYEEEKNPFLKEENKFIKRILKEEIPYLGICLGSQLLAKACEAKVVRSPVKEVGWYKVALKEEGARDPFFQGIADFFDVYHWHEDMFEIPKGAAFLATGSGCPNQAFKVGRYAYGVQFHVEITDRIIEDWCKSYWNSKDVEKRAKAREMVDTYQKKRVSFLKQSDIIYKNFENIIIRSKIAVKA